MNIARLTIVLFVTITMISLTAQLPRYSNLPYMPLARANPQSPCDVSLPVGGCSDYWVPAGPAMDTWAGTVFTDGSSEILNLEQSSPRIDMSDFPVTPDRISEFSTSPNFRYLHQCPKGWTRSNSCWRTISGAAV